MNEYVCDDRQDLSKMAEEIYKMSDVEFDIYLEQLKEDLYHPFF